MDKRKEKLFSEQKLFIDEVFKYTDSVSISISKLADNDCYTEDSEVLDETEKRISFCIEKKRLAEDIIRFCKKDPMTKERLFLSKWLYNEEGFRRENEVRHGIKNIFLVTFDYRNIIKLIGATIFPPISIVMFAMFIYCTLFTHSFAPIFTGAGIVWLIVSFFLEFAMIQDLVKASKAKTFLSILRLKGYLHDAIAMKLFIPEETKKDLIIFGGHNEKRLQTNA